MSGSREAALASPAEPAREALFTKLRPGPGKSPAEVAEHQRARIHSAMLEAATERGYRAVTVRELARLAGVSTRTFYEHYSGKEECFLRTHELAVRRVLKQMAAAQAIDDDWRRRLMGVFRAFSSELARDLRMARMVLVEAYAAGTMALDRVRWAEHALEARIAESLDRGPGGVDAPALLVRAVRAGMMSVACSRVLAGRQDELSQLAEGLLGWALPFFDSVGAGEFASPQWPPAGGTPRAGPSRRAGDRTRGPIGDRALILSTVAKLVSAKGFEGLTIGRICLAAGISRECFESHYANLDQCLLSALDLRWDAALENAADAKGAGHSEADRVRRAIAVLCDEFARDPMQTKLRFVGTVSLGSEGMNSNQDLVERLAGLLGGGASCGDTPPTSLATEASAGAIDGVVRHYVVSDRTQQLSGLTAFLTDLVIVPSATAQSTP